MTFVVLGVSPELKATLKFEIAKLGGKVIGSIYPDTTGIVSTKGKWQSDRSNLCYSYIDFKLVIVMTNKMQNSLGNY